MRNFAGVSSRWDLLVGQTSMPDFSVRIIHIDEQKAYDVFHQFEPLELAGSGGGSRKRDGRTQVIILRGISQERFRQFREACLAHPSVVDVVEITEDEFWRAPSNAI
jgi:hypothetical protein